MVRPKLLMNFFSTDQYKIEKEATFKGLTLHYLCPDVDVFCLEGYEAGNIGVTPVIMVRIVGNLILYWLYRHKVYIFYLNSYLLKIYGLIYFNIL